MLVSINWMISQTFTEMVGPKSPKIGLHRWQVPGVQDWKQRLLGNSEGWWFGGKRSIPFHLGDGDFFSWDVFGWKKSWKCVVCVEVDENFVQKLWWFYGDFCLQAKVTCIFALAMKIIFARNVHRVLFLTGSFDHFGARLLIEVLHVVMVAGFQLCVPVRG